LNISQNGAKHLVQLSRQSQHPYDSIQDKPTTVKTYQ